MSQNQPVYLPSSVIRWLEKNYPDEINAYRRGKFDAIFMEEVYEHKNPVLNHVTLVGMENGPDTFLVDSYMIFRIKLFQGYLFFIFEDADSFERLGIEPTGTSWRLLILC